MLSFSTSFASRSIVGRPFSRGHTLLLSLPPLPTPPITFPFYHVVITACSKHFKDKRFWQSVIDLVDFCFDSICLFWAISDANVYGHLRLTECGTGRICCGRVRSVGRKLPSQLAAEQTVWTQKKPPWRFASLFDFYRSLIIAYYYKASGLIKC